MKTVFAGCSITAGSGWPDGQDDSHLWCKLAHANIPALAGTDYVNVGIPGGSNSEIFEAALAQISTDVSHLIVQWTNFPRVNVKIGLEWWDPNTTMWQGGWNEDMQLSDRYYTREYVENILDRYMDLTHPHWCIHDILRYSQILDRMCAQFEITLTLVNGHCPWDEQYFTYDRAAMTPYTRDSVLSASKRSSFDVAAMYDKIHADYRILKAEQWVSLGRAFTKQKVDVNGDGQHPGALSNQLYYQEIAQHFANVAPDDKYSKGTTSHGKNQ